MPESSFWSLKIEGGDVFIYLGKDRLKLQKVYGKVLSVEKSTFKRATTLQFRFEPCPKGTHTKCHLKLKYFNRHNSDVNFKKMKETSHDEWVLRFNQEIERLNSVSRTATTAVNESSPKTGGVSMSARVCDDNEGGTSLNTSSDRSTSLRESTDLEITHITGNASSSADHNSCDENEDPLACSSPVATAETSRKRKTLEISPIHRIPSKRRDKASDSEEEATSDGQFAEMQKRCEESRMEGIHFLSIEKLQTPRDEILIRKIDPIFLEKLQKDMEMEPEGNYGLSYVLVKNCTKADFKANILDAYEYEVIGGLHNMTAAKALNGQYPDNPHFNGRFSRVYCGLRNEEALWLASRHNLTAAMRHEMSFFEEVEVCRAQLFSHSGATIDFTQDPPEPVANWRNTCAKILSRKKKLLTDVFNMAQLPARVWELFTTVNKKYEEGSLKNQKPSRKEVLTKMSMKAVHFQNLSALSDAERETLLKKVDDGILSIDEMKTAAEDIKKLRPVQEAIMVALTLRSWEEIPDVLRSEVTASNLARFMGRDIEHSEFRDFVKRLQKKISGEGSSRQGNAYVHNACDEFTLRLENSITVKSLLFFVDPFETSQQENIIDSVVKFQGAFLTIHELQACSDELALSETRSAVAFAQGINFTFMTTFNICLLFDPIYLGKVIEGVTDTGGLYSVGFIHQKGFPRPRDPLLLSKSVTGYLVGHWHISRKLVPEHFVFRKDEPRDGFVQVAADKSGKLPTAAYEWIVNHYSRSGDYVVDLFSHNAAAIVATMRSGRNGLYFGKEEAQENVRFHLASQVWPRKALEGKNKSGCSTSN